MGCIGCGKVEFYFLSFMLLKFLLLLPLKMLETYTLKIKTLNENLQGACLDLVNLGLD